MEEFPDEFNLEGLKKMQEEQLLEDERKQQEALREARVKIVHAVKSAIQKGYTYVDLKECFVNLHNKNRNKLLAELCERFPNHVKCYDSLYYLCDVNANDIVDSTDYRLTL